MQRAGALCHAYDPCVFRKGKTEQPNCRGARRKACIFLKWRQIQADKYSMCSLCEDLWGSNTWENRWETTRHAFRTSDWWIVIKQKSIKLTLKPEFHALQFHINSRKLYPQCPQAICSVYLPYTTCSMSLTAYLFTLNKNVLLEASCNGSDPLY